MGQVVEENQFMEQLFDIKVVTCICESLHYRMLLCRVIYMCMHIIYIYGLC